MVHDRNESARRGGELPRTTKCVQNPAQAALSSIT